MQKVAIYCRLSDEDKNKQSDLQDSESIQNQKTMLINYALQNGWEIYDLYSDDDYSGADAAIARPEFERLIKDAECKKFQIVLAKTQSRFTRDMEIVERYLHNKFMEWGIRFISVVDNTDTFNKANKKSRQINGLTNEWYLEDLSDNIKAVLSSKRRQGKYVGAFAPYGYKKEEQNRNQLIIDEPAAQIVQSIFKLYLEGYGLTRIAQYLNDRGIPCPAEYKRLNGDNYIPRQQGVKGKIWRDTSVCSILKNRVYCGDLVQGKSGTVSYKNSKKIRKESTEWIVCEDTHAPIISKDTFFKAMDIASTRTRPEENGKKHIFAGKLKCLDCQSVLVKRYGKKTCEGVHARTYFICPMKKFGVCGNGATVSYSLIYEKVFAELKHITQAYSAGVEIASFIMENDVIQEKIKSINAMIYNLERQLNDISIAMENLYMDKVKAVINETQFIGLSKRFSMRQEELNYQITLHRKDLDLLEKQPLHQKDKTEVVAQYVPISELTKEMIDEFIECIYIKNTASRGVKEVTILWNL